MATAGIYCGKRIWEKNNANNKEEIIDGTSYIVVSDSYSDDYTDNGGVVVFTTIKNSCMYRIVGRFYEIKKDERDWLGENRCYTQTKDVVATIVFSNKAIFANITASPILFWILIIALPLIGWIYIVLSSALHEKKLVSMGENYYMKAEVKRDANNLFQTMIFYLIAILLIYYVSISWLRWIIVIVLGIMAIIPTVSALLWKSESRGKQEKYKKFTGVLSQGIPLLMIVISVFFILM